MNDRELLELAAKASDEWPQSWRDSSGYMDGVLRRWNPLEDDSDAFRLAVKLEMSVEIHSTGVVVKDRYGCTTKVWTHPDPYAATRRAIVKAAAEFERENIKACNHEGDE